MPKEPSKRRQRFKAREEHHSAPAAAVGWCQVNNKSYRAACTAGVIEKSSEVSLKRALLKYRREAEHPPVLCRTTAELVQIAQKNLDARKVRGKSLLYIFIGNMLVMFAPTGRPYICVYIS